MADSNKVFVSPGIYTSEKDLTFVAQSVGVSTLGLAGETLKGPAFEPILIKSFDDFKIRFGGTSPEKDGNGVPKYQLPYVAKSYLQESNQLFVSRILGLSGYKSTKTYGLKLLGGIKLGNGLPSTRLSTVTLSGFTSDVVIYPLLSGKTSIDSNSIPAYITNPNRVYSDNDWFTIGLLPTGITNNLIGNKIDSPVGDSEGNTWLNTFYESSTQTVNAYLFKYKTTSESFEITRVTYSGATFNQYDGLVVASLRSRGSYNRQTLNLQTTNINNLTVSGSSILTNPLGEFSFTITKTDNTKKIFTCSLDSTSSKFITKVLGSNVFDKDEEMYPLYVHECYPNFINTLYSRGLIRGISSTPVTYTHIDTVSSPDFLRGWDTPISPMVVSEVRGNNVSDLFQVITISDGENANTEVKITIANVDLDTGDFDLLVRDFNDTDDNQSVLERYSRCSMNTESTGFIGLKIGTSDGQYELKSKYIMLSFADSFPEDAIPCGFRGFTGKDLGSKNSLGNIIYKTEYYTAGDIVTYNSFGEGIQEPGDKVKRVSLGLSSTIGIDSDLFKFKGNKNQKTTKGFHLSSNAKLITGATYDGFEFETTPYELEGSDKGKLEEVGYRKFTFALCGGFDGWDIYRNERTNSDEYIFGKKTYISGNTNNGGVFNPTVGNSDYYAYKEAIETFSNPESVDINLFATPGIDYLNNGSLIQQSIDMIENDRADSLYIIDSPSNIYTTSSDDAVNQLEDASLDSNYSATYWPWIQVKDNDNSTQIYLPPTGEVLRNLALTDNVSYPWFATAGYSRGLVNSIKAYKKLTLDERDVLYKNRINPIATFADTGTIIWGNKTLQVRESALDRINVRRLLLRARKLISAVAVRLLFDQNDDQVRNEFLRLVNPILDTIKKERGLYDFKVTVSNDPEDIDSNTLRGKIYIKPTRSLEFVDLQFIITPTGASFENV